MSKAKLNEQAGNLAKPLFPVMTFIGSGDSAGQNIAHIRMQLMYEIAKRNNPVEIDEALWSQFSWSPAIPNSDQLQNQMKEEILRTVSWNEIHNFIQRPAFLDVELKSVWENKVISSIGFCSECLPPMLYRYLKIPKKGD